jgi:hypothetical protein
MFQKQNCIYKKADFDKHINKSLLQFNYYNNYTTPLCDSDNVTDDIGWSCAIKSIQMCLSSFFIKWKLKNKIIPMFYQESGNLSIHAFVEKCKELKCDEKHGHYFGIFQALNIFKYLLDGEKILPRPIQISTDNIIDIDLLDMEKPTILFFSTRLGVSKLENYYKELILLLFSCEHFEGLLGGVGNSCYYFMAKHTCIDNLIYLDPHFITDYISDATPEKILETLMAKNYLSTHIDNLNPSMTFCFSYSNYDEFIKLKKFLEKNTMFNILHKKYGELKTISKGEWTVFQTSDI